MQVMARLTPIMRTGWTTRLFPVGNGSVRFGHWTIHQFTQHSRPSGRCSHRDGVQLFLVSV